LQGFAATGIVGTGRGRECGVKEARVRSGGGAERGTRRGEGKPSSEKDPSEFVAFSCSLSASDPSRSSTISSPATLA
jgi:hypothetical protein